MYSSQNNQLPCWASQEPAYSRVLNPGAGRTITPPPPRMATLALLVPLPRQTGPREAVDCVQDCGGVSARTIEVICFFKAEDKKIITPKESQSIAAL